MKVDLSPDQEAFIRQAIKDDRVGSTEQAIRDALKLWEQRERRCAEILSALASAESSIHRGEGLEMSGESLQNLAEDVKRRGRSRLEFDR